jgi:hypothetical protein
MYLVHRSVISPATSTPRIRFVTVRLPAKTSQRASRITNMGHPSHTVKIQKRGRLTAQKAHILYYNNKAVSSLRTEIETVFDKIL